MNRRKIGSLEVSEIGLGCNNFGGRMTEAETIAVVHAALDNGINFFDTADVYGATKSEEFLGRALKDRRSEAVIATKFGHHLDDERQGARPEYVKRACEDSLRRLNIETIDLYQLHRPDPSVPIEDTLGALNALVVAGKVREIGCSNFGVPLLREAASAVTPGGVGFVSVQNHFSLFHRGPLEDGVLAECEATGVGMLPYFPLASGLLTGKYRLGAALPASRRIQADSDKLAVANLEYVEKLIAVAESNGRTILELAFGWLLSFDAVASVIAGATSVEQIRANAAANAWRLSTAERNQIAAIPAPTL